VQHIFAFIEFMVIHVKARRVIIGSQQPWHVHSLEFVSPSACSQLTEHRGIANAACPYVALSGLYQSAGIHSFIHSFIHSC
jgi:hypothetical protein